MRYFCCRLIGTPSGIVYDGSELKSPEVNMESLLNHAHNIVNRPRAQTCMCVCAQQCQLTCDVQTPVYIVVRATYVIFTLPPPPRLLNFYGW